MKGFFSKSVLYSKAPSSSIPLCGSCGLYKTCLTPKMPVMGEGKRRILIVGEAPSKRDDKKGRHYTGELGDLLREALEENGVDLEEDCWTTFSVICKPKRLTEIDSKTIGFCRPNLVNTINDLQPSVIILLGSAAVRSCITHVWKEDIGSIHTWVGWKIPSQAINSWICPTYDLWMIPQATKKDRHNLLETIFKRHIKEACELKGKPYKSGKVPDYTKEVECVFSTEEAASIISQMRKEGGLSAFDFECDRIKPEPNLSKIVCASICQEGRRTISFPWKGVAKLEAIEWLKSSVPKIASNMKYEQRWCLAKLGIRPKNWVFDTMLAAHVLDNRQGITSLKFQAFVRMGVSSYNDHIEKFLSSSASSNEANEINEIDIEDLLLYNGLDSLLEYKLAKIQAKELGVSL